MKVEIVTPNETDTKGKSFMTKLIERCVANDEKIIPSTESVTAIKYNVEITDSLIESIMDEESKRATESPANSGSTAFVPPFFDDYVTALSDWN